MDYSKIISHPDHEEIVSKLVNGITPKDVNIWLKLKYSDKDQAHLRLSVKLLKSFIDNNLDLYQQLQQDVKNAKEGILPKKKIAESLLNNKSYRERLLELADGEIDIRQTMKETVFIIKQRVEQYFDQMQQNPQNLKPDYGLIKWFEVLIKSADTFYKIVEEGPDQRIEHNISIQMVDQYTAIFQEAIRETLGEMDPQAAYVFLEKFNEKLNALRPPTESLPLSQSQKAAQTQLISKQLSSITEESPDLIHEDFLDE